MGEGFERGYFFVVFLVAVDDVLSHEGKIESNEVLVACIFVESEEEEAVFVLLLLVRTIPSAGPDLLEKL